MASQDLNSWLGPIRESVTSYRRMIDATVAQLTDTELSTAPATGFNSVAIILRHLGGNLRSRWTDFLTTDGEKPDRHRETEFQAWEGDRQSLWEHFELGWKALELAIDSIDNTNASQTIKIRGEPHTLQQALIRSITHISYHAGQIAMVARMVHQGDWHWITIAPGASQSHNERTWGTASSRSIFAPDDNRQR